MYFFKRNFFSKFFTQHFYESKSKKGNLREILHFFQFQRKLHFSNKHAEKIYNADSDRL